jgi:methylenetetrahydrofolate reductase (NADPH)
MRNLLEAGCSEKETPAVSFEFFPPKTEKMLNGLWRSIDRLAPLKPRFVSVTYGAGGSTRARTHDIVSRIRSQTNLEPAAHLTCVGASVQELDSVIRAYHEAGVQHIVALRGDPPEGEAQFKPHPRGYDGSVELIFGLKKIADFEISVGAYPETHPESRGVQSELDHLKRKLDAGATRFITQFFFDNDRFLSFLDSARGAGIDAPIVPGILPVTNFQQVVRFSSMCGASVPAWFAHRFDGLDEDPKTRQLVAAHTAAEQCLGLLESGVKEFHFYTLNRADLVFAICHMLGVRSGPSSVRGRNNV